MSKRNSVEIARFDAVQISKAFKKVAAPNVPLPTVL